MIKSHLQRLYEINQNLIDFTKERLNESSGIPGAESWDRGYDLGYITALEMVNDNILAFISDAATSEKR